MSRIKTIWLLCILFFGLKANAQLIPFATYDNRDGLPSRFVSDVKQDKYGYIWLSTELGLCRFDGYNFLHFTIEDGLGDNWINTLYIDEQNCVWAGGYNGTLSYYRNGDIGVIANDSADNQGEIFSIFKCSGKIWVTTGSGLSFIQNDTLTALSDSSTQTTEQPLCYLVDSKNRIWFSTVEGAFLIDSSLKEIQWPELNDLIIRDIIEDKTGRMWFATQEAGIICADNGNFTFYDEKSGLSTNITLSLLEDKAGNIWVGTYYGGICKIENGVVSKTFQSQMQDGAIVELTEDRIGRIWARTLVNGIYMIENDRVQHIDKRKGLSDDNVTCAFEDNSGNIWFSTENGGISKLGKAVFDIFKTEERGKSNSINAILVAGNQQVYAGTNNGLIEIAPNGRMNSYNNIPGLGEEAYIYSIAEGRNNEIWLGTKGGLTHFRNKKFTYYPDSLFRLSYYEIFSNSLAYFNNTIYAATERGLIIFKNGSYSLLTSKDGLINDWLFSIAADFEGNIWCGSSEGLSIWDGKQFHNYTVFNGLSHNFCNDICFDSSGVAWIATDKGVSAVVLDKDFTISTRNYTQLGGLASNTVFSVAAGKNGHVWAGHNKGADCIQVKDKIIRNYGYYEGFLPIETKLGAIAIDSRQQVWFGTVDGIVRYNPQFDIPSNNPPLVYITNFKLYNDSTNISNYYSTIDSVTKLPVDLKLPHSKRNLIFDYVGLHYTIVEKNQYRYRLVGYEEEWTQPTQNIQTIPYRKLPHGKYTFEVIASNCDGVWSPEPASFSFEILAPWWKTWWAITLQILFGLGLLISIIAYRERKLKHDKKVLQEKVKERTLEIEKQKDKIEAQKKEITDSIEYAQHIQSAILPKDETIRPLLKEYFILYKPRNIVSGDFYWIDGDIDRVIAIAADCTGHGVPGAFMSMLGVSVLNQILGSNTNYTAGEILNFLRQQIIGTLSHSQKNEETRDGMDIALCIIDYKNLKVQFAGAYNPLIIIRDGTDIVLKADKMPVGSHIGELTDFTTSEHELNKGDCLYMFSDGYADQFGGPEGKKFKSSNFRQLLCEISLQPMPEQKEILDSTIENWKGGNEQVDDILVMGIRII